jgi:hypothetical protein
MPGGKLLFLTSSTFLDFSISACSVSSLIFSYSSCIFFLCSSFAAFSLASFIALSESLGSVAIDSLFIDDGALSATVIGAKFLGVSTGESPLSSNKAALLAIMIFL